MPTDPGCVNADEDFEFIYGCLYALVADSQASNYIFAGDLNFSPFSNRHDVIINFMAPHRV